VHTSSTTGKNAGVDVVQLTAEVLDGDRAIPANGNTDLESWHWFQIQAFNSGQHFTDYGVYYVAFRGALQDSGVWNLESHGQAVSDGDGFTVNVTVPEGENLSYAHTDDNMVPFAVYDEHNLDGT
jgi:hypothetical protein